VRKRKTTRRTSRRTHPLASLDSIPVGERRRALELVAEAEKEVDLLRGQLKHAHSLTVARIELADRIGILQPGEREMMMRIVEGRQAVADMLGMEPNDPDLLAEAEKRLAVESDVPTRTRVPDTTDTSTDQPGNGPKPPPGAVFVQGQWDYRHVPKPGKAKNAGKPKKQPGKQEKLSTLPLDRVSEEAVIHDTPHFGAVQQPGTTAGRNGERPDHGFPAPMAEEAFHGIAGRVCSILEKENETCREALLAQVLVGFGNLAGDGARTEEENYLNEFTLIVGATSTARKGTSLRSALNHLQSIEPDWSRAVRACPPTGEGIVWHLRDPRKLKGDKTDPGVNEKRALLRVEEFSKVMSSIAKGGTLSQRLRECWDHHNPLENLTKVDPIRASNTHVSLIAHSTPSEFASCVRTTDVRNGLINRFLIVGARGVKAVPRPKPIDWTAHPEIVKELRGIAAKFRVPTKIGFTSRAAAAWDSWYIDYRKQKLTFPVAFSELVGRAEAHVKRLAAIYAVLDGRKAIDEIHLNAAWAFWRYCSDSIQWAFPADENQIIVPAHEPFAAKRANKILDALRAHPEGLRRTEIYRDVFGCNLAQDKIQEALQMLLEARAISERPEGNGFSRVTRFYAET
jgi:hypothetical protein